jgi:hypothetical protein
MASRRSSGTRGLHCRRCGTHSVTGRCFIQPLPLAGISDGRRRSSTSLCSSASRCGDHRRARHLTRVPEQTTILRPFTRCSCCTPAGFAGLACFADLECRWQRDWAGSVTVVDLRSGERTPTSSSQRRTSSRGWLRRTTSRHVPTRGLCAGRPPRWPGR